MATLEVFEEELKCFDLVMQHRVDKFRLELRGHLLVERILLEVKAGGVDDTVLDQSLAVLNDCQLEHFALSHQAYIVEVDLHIAHLILDYVLHSFQLLVCENLVSNQREKYDAKENHDRQEDLLRLPVATSVIECFVIAVADCRDCRSYHVHRFEIDREVRAFIDEGDM